MDNIRNVTTETREDEEVCLVLRLVFPLTNIETIYCTTRGAVNHGATPTAVRGFPRVQLGTILDDLVLGEGMGERQHLRHIFSDYLTSVA